MVWRLKFYTQILFMQDENLFFIKEKIEEIKIALFKAEIDSILKLPNNIISTLKVDDEGSIWFYTSCNGLYAGEVDKEFFAYLEYHQKGRNTRLRISGKATVESSNDGAFTTASNSNTNNLLLLKLKIMHAEYLESDYERHHGWVGRIKTTVSDFLSASHARKYDFS